MLNRNQERSLIAAAREIANVNSVPIVEDCEFEAVDDLTRRREKMGDRSFFVFLILFGAGCFALGLMF